MHSESKFSIQTILPIIMAGGKGERLSPITDTVPKPLLPIDGIPVIERALMLLASFGFSRAVITLGYRARDIMDALGGSYAGIALSYTVEDTPLGTAGGVLSAWDTYAQDEDTEALILSGDAVFSLDLAAFFFHHTEHAADATLLSAHVDDPSAFGVLLCGGDGHIRSFCEKPTEGKIASDLVNAGIYLLSRRFLSDLPRSVFLDFGRDVFPSAVKEGQMLYAYTTDGYWCDIGTPEAFLNCVTSLANGALSVYSPLLTLKGGKAPLHVHRSAVGKRCHIPASATVSDSVLFDGVIVEREARITAAIVCRGVHIGSRAVIGAGAVIGEGAVIEEGAVVAPNARVAPYTAVKANATQPARSRSVVLS